MVQSYRQCCDYFEPFDVSQRYCLCLLLLPVFTAHGGTFSGCNSYADLRLHDSTLLHPGKKRGKGIGGTEQRVGVSHLLKGAKLIVFDNLLQAELQVLEHCTQLILVRLFELSVLRKNIRSSADTLRHHKFDTLQSTQASFPSEVHMAARLPRSIG